jgi:hypothetical protein
MNDYFRELHEGLHHGTFRGIGYLNSLISGPGVEDRLDPDVLMEPAQYTAYWPGGNLDGQQYASIDVRDASDEEAVEIRSFLRTLILAGSIGEAALSRWLANVDSFPPEVQQTRKDAGPLLTATVQTLCQFTNAPYAVLVTGKVSESSVIPVGSTLGVLHYPGLISPKSALASLRSALKRAMADDN